MDSPRNWSTDRRVEEAIVAENILLARIPKMNNDLLMRLEYLGVVDTDDLSDVLQRGLLSGKISDSDIKKLQELVEPPVIS
jgi:hypothetical protein